jgi:acyl dehydratase
MTSPRRFENVQQLLEARDSEIGVSGWHEVTQAAVDAFADLTGDHQWIHVDPVRAAGSAFGGTVAHGLFTLSLGGGLMTEVMDFSAFAHGLNYGYDKVRYPAPLPVGSRLRMRASFTDVTDLGGAAKLTVRQDFEAEGSDKPVCVAWQVVQLAEG